MLAGVLVLSAPACRLPPSGRTGLSHALVRLTLAASASGKSLRQGRNKLSGVLGLFNASAHMPLPAGVLARFEKLSRSLSTSEKNRGLMLHTSKFRFNQTTRLCAFL